MMKTIVILVSLLHISASAVKFEPTEISVKIAEDLKAGSSVYQATATAEAAESLAYTFVDDSTPFGVSNTGLVKLKDGQTVDHETKASYSLTITATATATATGNDVNAQTTTATLQLTVNVTNVAPSFAAQGPIYVETCSKAGTQVGTFEASDPGNTKVVYSIADENTGMDFEIDMNTGDLKVATGKIIDADRTRSYSLVLNAADSAATPLTGSISIVINVTTDGKSNTCETPNNAAPSLAASLIALSVCFMSYILK